MSSVAVDSVCVKCLQPDDTVNIAVDKINALLETFLGISDTELGLLAEFLLAQLQLQ